MIPPGKAIRQAAQNGIVQCPRLLGRDLSHAPIVMTAAMSTAPMSMRAVPASQVPIGFSLLSGAPAARCPGRSRTGECDRTTYADRGGSCPATTGDLALGSGQHRRDVSLRREPPPEVLAEPEHQHAPDTE